ncbi:MAG TPA: hypothetical protein VF169_22050 [Albitalea sp.]
MLLAILRSNLFLLVAAVAMAVMAIVLQPEPTAARTAAKPVAAARPG